jgi:hypothetical protein
LDISWLPLFKSVKINTKSDNDIDELIDQLQKNVKKIRDFVIEDMENDQLSEE